MPWKSTPRFLSLLFFFSVFSTSLFGEFEKKEETSKRVWILGQAGVGKSTFLNYMLGHLFKGEGTEDITVLDSSKPHSSMSSKMGSHHTKIPEAFTSRGKKQNITFIDVPIFSDKKNQKALSLFAELMKPTDTFFFLIDSYILNQRPYSIAKYLHKMLDFLTPDQFGKIVSNLNFVIRETYTQLSDSKKAYRQLATLYQKIDKKIQENNYTKRDLSSHEDEKDKKIAIPFAMGIGKRKINIWKYETLNKPTLRKKILEELNKIKTTEPPLKELRKKAATAGVAHRELKERIETPLEKAATRLRASLEYQAEKAYQKITLSLKANSCEISSEFLPKEATSPFEEDRKEISKRSWDFFLKAYNKELEGFQISQKASENRRTTFEISLPPGEVGHFVKLLNLKEQFTPIQE